MSKIKINLSRECVEKLANSIDYAACESRKESDALERIAGDLIWANDHRDEKGRLAIARETLDWVLGELDSCYCC